MSPTLSRPWRIVAASLALLLVVDRARSTNITCLPAYDWMSNSLGQNPCIVATYAQDACGGNWNVDPFPPPAQAAGYYYPGPNAASRSPCMCSTVTYSMFAACGVCQNGTFATWPKWTSNCSTTPLAISTFPEPIPAGTAFPAWVYLDVTAGFNIAAAQADDTAPNSTPILTSTSASSASTSASSSTSISSSLSSASPTSSSAPSSIAGPTSASHKTSNAGAIAGGVVGGIVGLAALAGLLALLLVRRRRSQPAPSVQDSTYGAVLPNSPPPMSHQTFTQPVYQPYDPSNPATYPSAVPTPTVHTTSSGYAPQSYGQQHQPGAYSGVPEL